MILHIPHASTNIPAEIKSSVKLSYQELVKELLVMTDSFTDDIFNNENPDIVSIIYPVSRLVIDPERFADDANEPMSGKGMGVIYEKTSDGKSLRKRPSQAKRDSLLQKYYHPHHEKLAAAVKKELERKGYSLIIDCHSFSSIPLPHEYDQSPDRPDICIGTDQYHTPAWLSETVNDLFVRAGLSVEINRPFSGSIVPMKYYLSNPKVLSVMIELNSKLYMDECTGRKNQHYAHFKTKLANIIEKIRDRADLKMGR